jgi:hypothetical protein
MLHSSATGRRREHTIPEALGLCQAASPTFWYVEALAEPATSIKAASCSKDAA